MNSDNERAAAMITVLLFAVAGFAVLLYAGWTAYAARDWSLVLWQIGTGLGLWAFAFGTMALYNEEIERRAGKRQEDGGQ